GPDDVRRLSGRCGARAVGWLYDLRTAALERLAELYPDDQHTLGLLQATLLGETGGVERRWTEDFRVTGTYHALVISGLHISVLAGTLVFLFWLIGLRRLPALTAATVVAWIYVFISGLNAPAIRAAGGFTLFLFASLFFRKTRVLNVLGFVGIVYLLFAPDQLFDPSFQLSFLSAAAIACFAVPVMERWSRPLRASVKRFEQTGYDPKVEERAAEWRVELRLLAETISVWTRISLAKTQWMVGKLAILSALVLDMVIVSACVQFGLALPMIAYFHRLSMTGLSANLIVVPLLSAIVPLGFFTIATGWHALAVITATLLRCAEAAASWHVRFEPAWRLAALPLWIAIAFSVALIVLAYAIRRGNRFGVAAALVCALSLFTAICLQPWRSLLTPGTLEVSAIDVGQGDSILVAFPNGQTMLVDAGGFPGLERMKRKPQIDIGEDVVSPYLWSRRIRHLDYVVITHGHSDHMAGAAAVLDNFRPAELWAGPEPETPEWHTVETHAADDHVAVKWLLRGVPDRTIGGVQIRILAPAPDYHAEDHAENNDSLVLELTYGKRRVVLEGDAELPSEEEMVADAQLRPVTLLKVGHHGSKTSSGDDLLSQLTPQFAFISDGYKNQFHHPHPTVLKRLAEYGIKVFRTDENGLLTFRTDGDKVEVRSFNH
ncbi:MAG: ComEC/Rec2 family competence protein, partial [Acidobacteriaceae bacterium]|nr:ComEC/Rec2 family competence protein [Acidobacteriaceae bacterium]